MEGENMDDEKKEVEVPAHQYALDGTALPSPLLFGYSHTASKVYEVVDGKRVQRTDIQGISFLADNMRLAGRLGEGGLISSKYELDGVKSSVICIANAYHKAPTVNSEFHVEVMPEKEDDIGQRIYLVLRGFTSISVGMGVSIDDIVVDISYNLFGGRGTVSITSKLPEVPESS
jgi:hypothetical protein